MLYPMQTQHALNPNEDLLPVGVAATILGVSTDTLKRWEKAGRISSTRTAMGHRRFRRGDLANLQAAS